MIDPDRDARVSDGYRALGREEPPRALDETILAASRRRGSRWAVPASIAAVVVLAVGVTLRVRMEERRGAEEVVLSPQVMQTPPPVAATARPEEKREMRAMQAPAAPPVAAAPAPAEQAAAGVAMGKISAAPETPERWLERIADLRKAGRDREADKSLAEFRKRYPGYRMSEAMRARVAPR